MSSRTLAQANVIGGPYDVAVMWGRKKREGDANPERIFVSHAELTRHAVQSGEHVAVVGRIFSTGDRYDGYYASDEGQGRAGSCGPSIGGPA